MSLKMILGKLGRHLLGRELYTRLKIGKRREYRFLRHVRGIIHVGANTGQEAELYHSFGLDVIWIEPIPEVFENLRRHVSGFPKQTAFNYLVTDEDDIEYSLHIANNCGASPPMLDNTARACSVFRSVAVPPRFCLFPYVLYKRRSKDLFRALTKRHPELFVEGDTLDLGATSLQQMS